MKTDTAFTIGNGVGSVGRVIRLIAGVTGVVALGITLVTRDILTGRVLAEIGVYVVAALVAYTAVFALIGERILARTNPWIGTAILLGPLVVIYGANLGPDTFRAGLGLYVSVSLILNAIISYGGCEVIAAPSLFFGQRYTVYCPWNAVDAVEKPFLAPTISDVPTIAALAIAMLVGGYFLVVDGLEVPAQLHLSVPELSNGFALLLVIPVAVLATNAWSAYQDAGRQWIGAVRSQLIGAVVLAILMVIFTLGMEWEPVWVAAMLAGFVYALVELLRSGLRQTQTEARETG